MVDVNIKTNSKNPEIRGRKKAGVWEEKKPRPGRYCTLQLAACSCALQLAHFSLRISV